MLKWYDPIKKRSSFKYGIMKLTTKPLTKKEVLFMNIITQEAKKKQAVVESAIRKGKSEASADTV